MEEVSGAFDWSFNSQEEAEYHLSAFNTIVEVMERISHNADGIMNLFPEYFIAVLQEGVDKGYFSSLEEAKESSKGALVKLFSINQRLAFIMATEISEAVGGPGPNELLMMDPIRREGDIMTREEVMDELKRIMRNNSEGGIQ